MHTTSFATLEEVKNYKSLQSYKYFIAGWVAEPKWKAFTDCCLILGKVNHSYAVSLTPLEPWVVIKSTGEVICGHCTCMAGLGETCSHIGALLYWTEYQVQRHTAVSSTSKPNEWLQPRTIKQVPFLRLEDIDFTSAECSMKKLYKQQMCQLQSDQSDNELSQLDSSHQPSITDQPAPVTSDHPATSDQLVQSGQSDHLDNDLTELFQKCSKSKYIYISSHSIFYRMFTI